MFDPISTYRIQFHKDFTFADFKSVIPYLHDLGVKTIYASPIFAAAPGSNHGYDVIDPHRINPEIGTLGELEEISSILKEKGMTWLQDIAPNHMAYHPSNAWLNDVLEKGRLSQYAPYFDIIWDVPQFGGKLMVPFLGSPLSDLIETGKLQITQNESGFALDCQGQAYPLNLPSYLKLMDRGLGHIPAVLRKILSELIDGDSAAAAERFVKIKSIVSQKDMKDYIAEILNEVNGDKQLLQQIADEQYYRLSYWKDSDTAINYRRFFTVNGLICLNIQNIEVFNDYHQFIKELLDKGIFQGLRVDHIDGLYDPAGYLERLRALAGNEVYIVVEKILETGEAFPADWPVQGNTGYDFLALVNNLLTSSASQKRFAQFFRKEISKDKPVDRAIAEKKAAILFNHMSGELDNLLQLFISLNLAGPSQLQQAGTDKLKAAIAEFLICCPVYRYYGNSLPLSKQEQKAVRNILAQIINEKPDLKPAVELIGRVFAGKNKNESQRGAALRFYQRCMQFTGPLMAKGVEDTLMYTHNRFIGHNEVGDSPASFGLSIENFHELMRERQKLWPGSMNATATHDTKRGEDVRARLNVLSERPDEWIALVKSWQEQYEGKETGAPDANDAYLIYQTLAGVISPPGQEQDDLPERMEAYLTKALREAKTHTQWAEPDEQYEKAAIDFTRKLLNPSGEFWKSIDQWQGRIADHFVLNALVQVLLKFTCPGVPDVYQGCELWDFSLVDPDNRRPVDFKKRSDKLHTIRQAKLDQLWEVRHDGSLKLWLTDKLLHQRAAMPELFSQGSYIPLATKGKYGDLVIAFARKHLRQWLVVVAPLHLAGLSTAPLTEFNWEGTVVILPEDAPLEWQNPLTADKKVYPGEIPVKQLLAGLPLCILTSEVKTKRSAGVILHITSLPSAYGIGDLGPQARNFADFLANGNQTYWQLLPVNPTGSSAGYSPYSACSSLAGYTLLISPDELVKEGLLETNDLRPYTPQVKGTVDFEGANAVKQAMFKIAFTRFNALENEDLQAQFNKFKKAEKEWLDDFALFEVLKAHHQGRPWYQWSEPWKLRKKTALNQFSLEHRTEIEYSKWLQFVFFRQWATLKSYSNHLGLRLFGDLPFYVSYDSADVWTNPTIFSLDEEHNMLASGGVPPDYFNADGQLWGMPVYRWDVLKKSGYAWWVQRMKKNRAFFDVIRLDHFRAFYDYWEVPASERTAVNGQWKAGPGADLFEAFRKALGELPFIAEDLGEVSPGVYELRDELGLPGMNLLQYAFGPDMPVSMHAPHNHTGHSVTYTGTHDNNTTLGWFKTDASPAEKQNLEKYLRTKISARNVSRALVEVGYSSVSEIAIVPLQDLLGLDTESRMNMPSSAAGNWRWQLQAYWPSAKLAGELRMLVKQYNR
jgi:malto-oligosyltrehalose synthase/4-alpha-glucanotransferase